MRSSDALGTNRALTPVVQRNLKLLQTAMRRGGFFGVRTEWWHFVAYDWKKYAPMREAKRLGPGIENRDP